MSAEITTAAMSRKGWGLAPTITKAEARALTEEIRAAVEDVWRLLIRAHETKAWKALGYERWVDYISGEFHKSRAWSYQLLDQAEVITEIEAAAGISDVQSIGHVDGKTAREIKPILPDITFQIRDRIKRGEEPETAVRETVAVARRAAASTPKSPRGASGVAQRYDELREMARKGFTAAQIANRLGLSEEGVKNIARKQGIEIIANKVMGKTRRHDSNRIVRETVHGLEGTRISIGLVDFSTLEAEQIEGWVSSLTDSIKALNGLKVRLVKEQTRA